jgi:DNA (cytosine-5)-methyltransferase 1
MRHGSLFSGIGGFDLASAWMGWENKFHCEWNPFGQKVLHHYWPESEQFTDITKTNFTKYANRIDILTGGFPCQPYSSAGKRKGKEDERHLWPEMLRAIREIQPSWVVGENVLGLVNWSEGLVSHEVQTDLEAEGYEVQPYVLPAVSVNAPHRRDRVWFVAKNTKRNGCIQRESKQEGAEIWEQRNIGSRSSDRIHISERHASDTDSNGQQQCDSEYEIKSSQRGINALGNIDESNGNGDASDSSNKRREQCRIPRQISETKGISSKGSEFRIPIKTIRNGYKPNWENFPTVSPICNGDDGLSDRLDGITFSKWRNESIKAGGNAIVPQVAYQIFKAIEQYEQLNNKS